MLVKLKAQAIQTLVAELKPNKMLPIYLMGLGAPMPDHVTRADLIKIIGFLFLKLDWVEDVNSSTVKLKSQNAHLLLSELQPNQVLAVYMMGTGTDMPENVTKGDLIKIIGLLCQKLNWTQNEDEQDQTPPITEESTGAEKVHISDHLSSDNTDIESNCYMIDGTRVQDLPLMTTENLSQEEFITESEISDVLNETAEKNNKNKGLEQKLTAIPLDQTDFSNADLNGFKIDQETGASPLVPKCPLNDADLTSFASALETSTPILKPYNCSNCERTFSQHSNAKQHEKACTKVLKQFECKQCSKKFDWASALKIHELMHSDVKPYSCSDCDDRFKFPASLVQHKKRRHDSSSQMNTRKKYQYRKTYNCSSCDRTFMNPAHIKLHEEKCNVPKSKQFECKRCSKTFEWASTLKMHELMHSDVKPYSCSDCDDRFKFPASLVQHKKRRHDSSCQTNTRKKYQYRKTYNCSTVMNPANIKRHEEKCSQLTAQNCSLTSKSYNCAHCSRKIDGNLRRHEEFCRKFQSKIEPTNDSDNKNVQTNDSFSMEWNEMETVSKTQDVTSDPDPTLIDLEQNPQVSKAIYVLRNDEVIHPKENGEVHVNQDNNVPENNSIIEQVSVNSIKTTVESQVENNLYDVMDLVCY